jgi:hypothetical protein
MVNVAGTWQAKKNGDVWQVLDGEGRLIATLVDISDAEAKAKQIAVSPYVLSISKTGHFLNRTLWHNQAALTSSLRPWL